MTQPIVKTVDQLLLSSLSGAGIYAVGGRVRDEVLAALGRPPPMRDKPDLDYLVTGLALQDIIARLGAVGRAELVGASFGIVKFTRDSTTVDVALPRREWSVGTHHRDFRVESAPDIPLEADLARRDFRVNMMARDLRSGDLIDPFGGRADLEARRLDIVKAETFVEDPLRVLRGAQIAARFDLKPTTQTLDAMRAAAHLITTVAPERMADELSKLLERAPKPSAGFELLRSVGVLEQMLPELMEGWEVEQNEFHAHTVYYHSLIACDAAPASLVLRLGALFHDVGKPRTKDGPHFYRHEQVGAEMTRAALSRLRFGNDLIDRVCALVRYHMYSAIEQQTDAAIRRFIRRVGQGHVEDLFALRHADVAATGLPPRAVVENQTFEDRVRKELSGDHPLSVTDLAIDGDDVIGIMRELGVVGPDYRGDHRVGDALRQCLELVLDEPSRNQKEALRAFVRERFKNAAQARGQDE